MDTLSWVLCRGRWGRSGTGSMWVGLGKRGWLRCLYIMLVAPYHFCSQRRYSRKHAYSLGIRRLLLSRSVRRCDRGPWGRVQMSVAGTPRRIVVFCGSVDIDKPRRLLVRRGCVNKTGHAVSCFWSITLLLRRIGFDRRGKLSSQWWRIDFWVRVLFPKWRLCLFCWRWGTGQALLFC